MVATALHRRAKTRGLRPQSLDPTETSWPRSPVRISTKVAPTQERASGVVRTLLRLLLEPLPVPDLQPKNAPKEIAIPEDDVALLPPVVYSPPAAESAGISISSRHSFIPKPSDYCSGCETTHARNEFSPWQRAARDHERLCLGREGSFSLCRHQRINFGAIEQALPRTQLSTTTAGVILRCEDESHLKGTRHHLDRSARLDDEAMMPQVSVGIEEDGAVMLSTYFEELVCIVPAGEPLLVRQLRQKLDLLQAASTNCICGHVNINSERIVDLAESISCPYLHEAEGGCQSLSGRHPRPLRARRRGGKRKGIRGEMLRHERLHRVLRYM
ncbi:uncharacterized protein PG998_010873 [Apiospora kogelbergensis]|uniref:uncharacterized protein n=1 Tax=Apiospora kogelbergensis TaxID=1337665 RepID=UPI003130A503